MRNKNIEKKRLIWGIVIVVLAVLYVAVFESKTEVSPGLLPGFPSDIPIEKDAKITQNFEATDNDGRHQATRVFASQKTVQENYQLYTDFFKKNGWETKIGSEAVSIDTVFASKNGIEAVVNITRTATGSQVEISIVK